MIVSFSVSNFRSFSKEETFSMVASKRLAGKHEDHALSIPGSRERVLKTAVIYGANGAGKSNLFKAIRYLRTVALNLRENRIGTGREPFLFDEFDKLPSSFDIQFITNESLYRFGVVLDDRRISEEWLVRIDGKKEVPLYERITDSKGGVKVDAEGLKSTVEKIEALATVGGRQNHSFLATIRANLNKPELGDELLMILKWFETELVMIAPDESFGPLGPMLAEDPKFREFAGEFLNAASTGVDHLVATKKEITKDELLSGLPDRVRDSVKKDLIEGGEDKIAVYLNEETDLLIERDEENHYYRISIQAAHKNNDGEKIGLGLSQESDGTRRLLNLVPALHHLKSDNAVYIIDEIDRSMHPMLVKKFLEYFLKVCRGENRQLIVTTHESNLLTLELLRRDEIWFAEKDPTGSTRIYSMSDYKVRTDLEIRKHYLQGRFGAIPFLGDIDQFMMQQDSDC